MCTAKQIRKEWRLPKMILSTIDPFAINVDTCTVVCTYMLLVILALLLSRHSKKQGTVIAKEQYPPYAPVGFLKAVAGLSSLQAPSFLLDLARKTSSDIFKLPIPVPGGFYVINHPAIAREILTDRSTDKPAQIYASFDKATGHESIFQGQIMHSGAQ